MKKVLVVWYKNFEYLDRMVNAFRANNIEADKFTIEYFYDYANCLQRIGNSLGIKHFKSAHNKKMRDDIIKKCEKENFDSILILTGNFREVIDDEFLSWAKHHEKKLLLWFIDSVRNFKCYDEIYFKNFKGIYSFEPTDIKYLLNKYNVGNAKYLPVVADETIYNNENNALNKVYDICFVGVASLHRAELLEAVARYCDYNNKTMIVYGHMWRFRPYIHMLRHRYNFKKKYPKLYKYVINKFINSQKVAELYKKSRIVLNIAQSDNSAANSRTFEILATNSFQIVGYNPSIEALFKDGKELVMYKNSEELINLIDYYLDNAEKRVEIASTGCEKVMKEFLLKRIVREFIQEE